MYWSVSASEVMKMNPGHYVSLIIPLPDDGEENSDDRTVRFTRVKLLRPSDTLVLGRAYRLVTSQGYYLYYYYNKLPNKLLLLFLNNQVNVSVFFLNVLFGLSCCRGDEGFESKKVCKDEEEPAGINGYVGDRSRESEFKL